ncbi:MAG: TriB protein, partial [Haemophilus parainfluenzae]
IAITLCGFKILFNGESVRDCKNIIIGAAFIVGAVEVTNMLYGK